MKKLLLATALMLSMPLMAQAAGDDVMGGPDGSTQTIHHCGFTPTTGRRYTTSGVTTRIVERKLSALGYKHVSQAGIYGKQDKAAVKQFQRDQGIAVDGIVGPITAQRLAYVSHPSANVHRCYGMAADVR